MNLAELRDCSGAPNGSQAAFVPVLEVLAWLALQITANGLGDEFTLLDGGRRDSGQHLAVLVFQRSQVADHEHFGMARKAEVGLDEHSAGTIARHSEFLSQGRSRDARGPQDHRSYHARFAEVNCPWLDLSHHR